MRARLLEFISSPLGSRVVWVLFAILFYQSGLAFTTWLISPDAFGGGADWIWVALFPVLFPAFFVVNRRFGCATGACRSQRCDLPTPGLTGDQHTRSSGPWPMP